MRHDVGVRLRVAQVVDCTEAEGPGRRLAVWLQGCPLRCAGCCNPEMLGESGGEWLELDELADRIGRAAERDGIEGISLLGGEPTAQAAGAATLAWRARAIGLSVMVYTGFTLAELVARRDAATFRLLARTDVLVDGPYLRDRPERSRRWVGSANQRVHLLTDRYRADDPRWSRPNTIELRLQNGVLAVNGFPAATAVGLWKRPRPAVAVAAAAGRDGSGGGH